jgi:hypothetical protein
MMLEVKIGPYGGLTTTYMGNYYNGGPKIFLVKNSPSKGGY